LRRTAVGHAAWVQPPSPPQQGPTDGEQQSSNAKNAKVDEFYTQFADIEKEMNAYLEFDPDVFRGETVLLPCDDPQKGETCTLGYDEVDPYPT
jgi:hypothetical protein